MDEQNFLLTDLLLKVVGRPANNSEFEGGWYHKISLISTKSKPTLSIMYIYQCLTFIYLSVCLPVFLFIYLSIYLLVYI